MALTAVDTIRFPSSIPIHPSNAFNINAVEAHVAYVITAPKTGTLKKIGWYCYGISSPVLTMKISVETVADSVGAPVATSNATKTLYVSGAESADLTSFVENTTYFTAINGTTGINVTIGDKIAVTFRCTAYTSGYVRIPVNEYNPQETLWYSLVGQSYVYTYSGSTATVMYTPYVTLEYDGEFVQVPSAVPVPETASSGTTIAWNSSSNPDRRGIKFKFPYGCSLSGAFVAVDLDSDCDIILYDSDEYTVMTGFPITLDKDKRRSSGTNWFHVPFPTQPTLTADTFYRLVVLPKSTTNIEMESNKLGSDGTITGMSQMPYNGCYYYTTFNGEPSSGSHSWTDDSTNKILVGFGVFVNKIDLGSSSGGSSPRFGDMTGGLR